MGIINNDSMDTDDGFSVTGAYVSVGSNRVSVQRTGLDESNVATYNIRFSATFWKDKIRHGGMLEARPSRPWDITLPSRI